MATKFKKRILFFLKNFIFNFKKNFWYFSTEIEHGNAYWCKKSYTWKNNSGKTLLPQAYFVGNNIQMPKIAWNKINDLEFLNLVENPKT